LCGVESSVSQPAGVDEGKPNERQQMINAILAPIILMLTVMPVQLPEAYRNLEVIEEVVAQDKCVEWTATALAAGWQPDDLPRLMRVMYRESRCLPDACSIPDRPDLRRCRDWGLMQINDYSWKTTVRSYGFQMEHMHNPFWNLWFARWLFEYSEDRNGCGWQPWYGKC
jgi:hypothetical protein